MPWVFCALSALLATCVAHALRPLRRPWWLKLPSFNLGWFVNELPVHALIGTAVTIAVVTPLGALDELPGQVGLVLTAGSIVGLLILAAAHQRAGAAMDTALRDAFGSVGESPASSGQHEEGEQGDESIPRSWLALPWLAWRRPPGIERIANVVYATVAGRDLQLDVYRPTSARRGCPVLVEIHGGGWITGDRRLEARPLVTRMAAQGWVCISVDYRVGRRATWPDHIVDVNTALTWVSDHVADYGGDPGFVALTGGSAGGHLAALAALTPNDSEYLPLHGPRPRIRACVPFYGVYDFDNSLRTRSLAEQRLLQRLVVRVSQAESPDVYARAAPLARVIEDAPPFLVIHGTSDNLIFPEESWAFVDRLRAVSRAPVAYAEIPRGQHAFDAVPSIRTAHVIAGVERFLTHIHSVHRDPTGCPPITT